MNPVIKISLFFIVLFLATLHNPIFSQKNNEKEKFIVSVEIVDTLSKEGVSFAIIEILEMGIGAQCDIDGACKFRLDEGKYTLRVRSLGYAPTTYSIVVKNNQKARLPLNKQTILLDEFNVMGNYDSNIGSQVSVNQAAIEYIQPSSISDVLILLPGSIVPDNDLHAFNGISSRQVGQDDNSSLGMSFVENGVAISNDGSRSQLLGLTGYGKNNIYAPDGVMTAGTSNNSGVDMRNISTDHIQSIEIVRGISSVKEGNLSSGVIKTKAKQGVSPLTMRLKTDPLTKLFYMGKGFKMPNKKGTLHLGVDALYSKTDVRELLESFSRISSQANYNNIINIADKSLDINLKFSSYFTLNKNKTDEIIELNNEMYRFDSFRSALSLNSKYYLELSWIDRIELISSIDYNQNLLEREFIHINSGGPLSMPLATTEGEHEGKFLAQAYKTRYEIDNKPIYFFSQLNGDKNFKLNSKMNLAVLAGIEYRQSKNLGKGTIVNAANPPFPQDNSFIRPRANYLIPAMINLSYYLENKLNYSFSYHNFNLSTGIRATQMLNLPQNYALSKLLLLEPRIELKWKINRQMSNGKSLENVFRIGYGEENKLPTLDYLHPDKIYKDYVVLNAFYNDSRRNRLITNTVVHNMENKHLRENKNRKLEFGWDMQYDKWFCSLSAFFERSSTGFEYQRSYYPISYTRYIKPKGELPEHPTKDDFIPETYKDFAIFMQPANSLKVEKKGIEYRIRIPEIKIINTHIEVNGAYYKTMYSSSTASVYRPSIMLGNDYYPYVGIYDKGEHSYKDRLNTNFWFNTHIPKHKLIFTNFIQIIWYSSSYNGREESQYPSQYIDLDGKIFPFDKSKQDESVFYHLYREKNNLYYAKSLLPVSFRMNFKASKEFGQRLKCSFFVDNIIDINPKYKTRIKETKRQWILPFFGVEVNVSI